MSQILALQNCMSRVNQEVNEMVEEAIDEAFNQGANQDQYRGGTDGYALSFSIFRNVRALLLKKFREA